MSSIKNIPKEYIVVEKKPINKFKRTRITIIKSMKVPGIFFSFGSSYIKYNKDETFNINLPSNANITMIRFREDFDFKNITDGDIQNIPLNNFCSSSFKELQIHFS